MWVWRALFNWQGNETTRVTVAELGWGGHAAMPLNAVLDAGQLKDVLRMQSSASTLPGRGIDLSINVGSVLTSSDTHTKDTRDTTLSQHHQHQHDHPHDFSSDEDADEHAHSSRPTSSKRPHGGGGGAAGGGNREAVRKYRMRKKAHFMELEEEVASLKRLNGLLMQRLSRQVALEQEVVRLRAVVADVRQRVEACTFVTPPASMSLQQQHLQLQISPAMQQQQPMTACEYASAASGECAMKGEPCVADGTDAKRCIVCG
eukprot:jgi/Chlat1/7999/Chrsp7S07755